MLGRPKFRHGGSIIDTAAASVFDIVSVDTARIYTCMHKRGNPFARGLNARCHLTPHVNSLGRMRVRSSPRSLPPGRTRKDRAESRASDLQSQRGPHSRSASSLLERVLEAAGDALGPLLGAADVLRHLLLREGKEVVIGNRTSLVNHDVPLSAPLLVTGPPLPPFRCVLREGKWGALE